MVGYIKKEADFRNFDLRNAPLNGLNLSGVDFSGAQLQGACLWHTNFYGSAFCKANLTKAKLRGISFRYANLTDAILDGVEARGGVVKNIPVRDELNPGLYRPNTFAYPTKTIKVALKEGSCAFVEDDNDDLLYRVDKFILEILYKDYNHRRRRTVRTHIGSYFTITARTNFEYATLHNTRFENAQLKRVIFRNAKFHYTNFIGANTNEADFSNSNVEAAIFDENLERTVQHGATIRTHFLLRRKMFPKNLVIQGSGKLLVQFATEQGFEKIAIYLVNAKHSLPPQVNQKKNLLHVAARKKLNALLKTLVQIRFYDPNHTDENDNTPLHQAAISGDGFHHKTFTQSRS